MKLLSYIFSLFLLSITINLNAESISFSGSTVRITGHFDQLAIHGNDKSEDIVATDLLTTAPISEGINIRKEDDIIHISISGDRKYRLDIPSQWNVKCTLDPIVEEGNYIFSRDARNLHFYYLKGDIEVNADGYNVELYRTIGSVSIVTYEDIKATLPYLQPNSVVSLDTYKGNVLVKIAQDLEPKIKASAKIGKVTIGYQDDKFNKKGKGNDIILNSENGKWVSVSSIDLTPAPPTHPELRDQLIKMYIEDQGKLRMPKITRAELTALGYGPFIETMSDVYQGHQSGIKHKKQVQEILEQYGMPTEKMVGAGYAYRAIQLIYFQFDETLKEKYKEQYIQEYGDNFIKILSKVKPIKIDNKR